jgi:hypothetical protein
MPAMKDKLKVYLDNCCFNRPFDESSQLLVRWETEAEPFDYTKFHHTLFEGMTFDELCEAAFKAGEEAEQNEI